MQQNNPIRRAEVVMAGIGGRGVLLAGKLLAEAAMSSFSHVIWFPSYAAAMRGGPCECTVIISEAEIASPVLSTSEAVIIMEDSQLNDFISRVKPGGMLFIDSSIVNNTIKRSDIEVVSVPATELALKLGEGQVSNLVLLGAYLEKRKIISIGAVEAELGSKLAGRKEALLNLNKLALAEGARAVSRN